MPPKTKATAAKTPVKKTTPATKKKSSTGKTVQRPAEPTMELESEAIGRKVQGGRVKKSTGNTKKKLATVVTSTKGKERKIKKKFGPDTVSLLDVVDRCDNVPYMDILDPQPYLDFFAKFWKFSVYDRETVVGFMYDRIVKKMPWNADFIIDKKTKTVVFDPRGAAGGNSRKPPQVRPDPTANMESMLQAATGKKVSPGFDKFHKKGECYGVYGAPEPFGIDRTAASLFGFVAAGSYLCAYTWKEEDGSNEKTMYLWVPRRSWDKVNEPGMLDNSAAGGIPLGHLPRMTMVAEANEEANLDRTFLEEHLKSAGAVTYFWCNEEKGAIIPRIRFVYDLEVLEDMKLKPNDDEAMDFRTFTVEELILSIKMGEMKTDPAIIWLDFLIRHGVIATEDEPNVPEIMSRIHRKLPFNTPYTVLWNVKTTNEW